MSQHAYEANHDIDHVHFSSVPAIICGIASILLLECTNWVPEKYVIGISLATYALLGYRIIWEALKNIIKGRMLDENFLMSIATLGALGIGEYLEAVGVMLFYQVGIWFEEYATERSKKAVTEVLDLRSEEVRLISPEGDISIIDPKAVLVGSLIEIRPGDRVPLDGIVVEGTSRIDTSPITGEPIPYIVEPGKEVVSGSINKQGRLVLKVTHMLRDSVVTKILETVQEASASKPKIDRFISRFAKVYTPIVVLIAILTATIPPLLGGDISYWLYTALTFLVISCPCALVISVPLAFFSAIGLGSKKGILFKGGKIIEQLSNIKMIGFDKTGTLTTGKFSVKYIDVVDLKVTDENDILRMAAGLEQYSTHPIGKAIVEAATNKDGALLKGVDVQEVPGRGMRGVVVGHHVCVGNRSYMDMLGIKGYPEEQPQYGTEVLVAVDNLYLGRIILADTSKYDAKASIELLKEKGYQVALITGDSQNNGKFVGDELHIDIVYGGLLPHEKLEAIKELRYGYGNVLFVGDGINDAPVLAGADVSGAMSSGSDAAIEVADIVFMRPDVVSVVTATMISKETMKIAWQNIILAICIKLVVMLLGIAGFANMWWAVFADTGVAIICILNSIRLFYKKI